MKWREFVVDYLSFSRRDRVAILFIILFVIVGFFLPGLVSLTTGTKSFQSDTSWIASLRNLEQNEEKKDQTHISYARDENSSSYHYFYSSIYSYETVCTDIGQSLF